MGKHVKRSTVVRAAIVPSAAAAVIAAIGAGTSLAEPLTQAAVTDAPPVTQAAVTEAPPATQGAVTTASQPEPVYWAPPGPQYQNIEYRPLENYDYDTNTYAAPQDTYVAPVKVEELHLPVAVEAPTAPILAPRNMIRIGDYLFTRPNWITDTDAARTNNSTAVIEAQVTDAWRSIGVDTTRAERLAAAQIGGTAAGVLGGAAIGAVPGALVGGTIGGIQGAGIGGMVMLPQPLPVVTTGVAGTAAGAVLGGAITAVPGAVIGGAAGLAAGTVYGAGEGGEPTEVTVADVDREAITTDTRNTLAQWDASSPAGQAAANTIRDAAAAAAVVDQQARDWVASQPGGEQVIGRVDTALSDFFENSTPGLAANLISGAVGAGIQA